MVSWGQERQKAASGGAHQLDSVTKKLKNLQWRTKKSTKALVIFIITIPTVVVLVSVIATQNPQITRFDQLGCKDISDHYVITCK